MEKYCSVIGQRVKPENCGTFKECGDPAQCGLRKYYGWADMGTKGMQARQEAQQQIKQAAKDEADLERFGPRTCNICHKEFSAPEAFRMRKDGKGRKKTCITCEDKYIKKTPSPKPRKKNSNSVKTKPTPEPAPKVNKDPEAESHRGGAIKLSDFTWLENLCGRDPIPKVKIHKNIIAFNAAAKRKFKDVLDPAQTVNVGYRRNGKGLEIAFDLRPDLFGAYRLTKKLDGSKKEVKVNVSLYRHGVDIKPAAYPVKLVGGVLVVEVG